MPISCEWHAACRQLRVVAEAFALCVFVRRRDAPATSSRCQRGVAATGRRCPSRVICSLFESVYARSDNWLEMQLEKLRKTLNAAADPTVLVDDEGRIVFGNDQFGESAPASW